MTSVAVLNQKAVAYFDLLAQIHALEAKAEGIKSDIMQEMFNRECEILDGDGWRSTWHNVSSSRFDNKSFKADHPDL